jgi:hypothetical protein
MEDYIPQPKTIQVTPAAQTYKQGKGYNQPASADPQMDKVTSKVGTGKDYDALVQTLKMAVERGDIDKENVHRLAHGLGIKPDTLASMIGAGNKETIQAEDQDESPETEVAPPDVQKDFKDFRDEISAATSVTEATLSPAQRTAIRKSLQKTGASASEINAELRRHSTLARSSGSASSAAAAGRQEASNYQSAINDPVIARRVRALRTAALRAGKKK